MNPTQDHHALRQGPRSTRPTTGLDLTLDPATSAQQCLTPRDQNGYRTPGYNTTADANLSGYLGTETGSASARLSALPRRRSQRALAHYRTGLGAGPSRRARTLAPVQEFIQAINWT